VRVPASRGHIDFYLRENKDQFLILGVNQLNQISETWNAKDRLLSARWPNTFDLPATGADWTTQSGANSANET
jgi:hypothetical protein